jgi:hypothetical protein
MIVRLGIALVLTAVVAAPAAADVTVNQKVTGKGGLAGMMSGDSVQHIKGTKMRIDQKRGDNDMSTIIDADAQRMISVDHGKKEAEIIDMTKLAADMAKISSGDISATVTPTGETRQIAGKSCAVHNMAISVPMQMGSDGLTVTMAGPACLVKDAPGAGDYQTFYKTAAEKGLFFGDPRQAKAQPGQAKGMAKLYQEMAARGIPYSSELTMKFEGAGPMAAMMNKMGGMTMLTEVVSVSSDAIADSMFDVPAGYKTKQR